MAKIQKVIDFKDFNNNGGGGQVSLPKFVCRSCGRDDVKSVPRYGRPGEVQPLPIEKSACKIFFNNDNLTPESLIDCKRMLASEHVIPFI